MGNPAEAPLVLAEQLVRAPYPEGVELCAVRRSRFAQRALQAPRRHPEPAPAVFDPERARSVELVAKSCDDGVAFARFAADCLETIEEIGVENAEYFHEAGGEKFARLPCLNDTDEGMRVLEDVARRELMGWV